MPPRLRITGLGAVTALGTGVEALWAGALAGRVALRRPRFLDTTDLPECVVGEVDLATEATADRALVLAGLAAREALGDAGWSEAELRHPRTALIVASTKAGIGLAQRVLEQRIPPKHLAGFPLFALARRLASALGVGGAVETVSVACASGIAAAGHGRALIAEGRAERVLVVGTDALSEFIWRGFLSLRAIDPGGARPFDRRRAGLTVGEGAAALALEGGDGPARAWLLGHAGRSDANHITGPARDGRGLARALEDALAGAEVPAEAVAFVAAHGTATRFNDAMEDAAYRRVFGDRPVPVQSIKGAIGHVLGGAGLVNLLLAVRGLEAGLCPPTAGLAEPDPELAIHPVSGSPVPMDGEYAVACAAGFAGINGVAVLGRAVAPRRVPVPVPVPVSGSGSGGSGGSGGGSGGGASPAGGGDLSGGEPGEGGPDRDDRLPGRVAVTAAVRLPLDRGALVARVGPVAARRLDDFCLAGMAAAGAALEAARSSGAALGARAHALYAGTALGCLESDHAYYAELLEVGLARANPRIFAYTLPSVVLGETAIAHGLTGDNLVFSAGRASALTAFAHAARAIARGEVSLVLVLALDVEGPATRRLLAAAGRVAEPCASAFVLESEPDAIGRGAPILGWVESASTAAAPVADLGAAGADAASSPGTDPLGCGGVAALVAALPGGGAVEVVCPAGFRARVTVAPAGPAATSAGARR